MLFTIFEDSTTTMIQDSSTAQDIRIIFTGTLRSNKIVASSSFGSSAAAVAYEVPVPTLRRKLVPIQKDDHHVSSLEYDRQYDLLTSYSENTGAQQRIPVDLANCNPLRRCCC